MRRLILIARREIAAYASVPSFWIALLLGPALILVAGFVGMASHAAPAPSPPQTLAVIADDGGLRAVVADAVAEANRLGPAPILVETSSADRKADTRLALSAEGEGAVSVTVGGRALPPTLATTLRDKVAAELRGRILRAAGTPDVVVDRLREVRVDIASTPPGPAKDRPDAGAQVGRFAIVLLLWMNLVGALGMLLQAIIRERTYRTLEGLLASAKSTEIIFGKLAGVGILSIMVLGSWLGVGAMVAASPLGAAGAGFQDLLLGAFRHPASLVQAGAVYLLAFVMYGSALIGLGAVARDLPAAQNLSRPIFGVLLLVFFVALTQLTGAVAGLSWLVWVPPFTPFVVLMAPPGQLSPAVVAGAFILMFATTALVAALASRALTEAPLRLPGFRRASLPA